MQRLYEISFFVGVALVAGFACTFALSLLALIQVATKTVIQGLVGVLAIFVPLNILFWRFNRRRALRALKFPIPARIFDIGFGILMGLVVLMLVLGWLGWSAAPIRPSATGYVDKSGKAAGTRLRRLSAMGSSVLRRVERDCPVGRTRAAVLQFEGAEAYIRRVSTVSNREDR